MNRNHLVAVLLVCSSISSFSQDGTEVKKFYTKDDVETDEQHGYYYSIGKVKKGVLLSYIDTVRTFYFPSNVRRSIMVYNELNLLSGSFILYHENGNLKEKGFYIGGNRRGYFTSWYADGKLHRTTTFVNAGSVEDNREGYSIKIVSYWDSLGNQIIRDGKGYCKCYLSNGSLKEEGRVIEGGRKDSVWLGFRNNVLQFKEHYESGNLVHGTRYSDGREYHYKNFSTQAEYNGGMEELYKFLQKNLRFPSDVAREGINGKVFTQFSVGTDGTVSELETIKGLHKSADAEANRLIRSMPKWIPATTRGIPVKSKFVLPLTFKIER